MMFGLIGVDIVLRLLIIEKHKAAQWIECDQAQEISAEVDAHDTVLQPTTTVGRGSGAAREATPGKKSLPVMLVLLKSRRIEAAFLGTFAVSATMAAFDSTLPLFVNRVFDWDALGAGLIFVALLFPHLAGPVIGKGVDKYGPRWIATSGFLLLLPFWVLLRLVDHDSIRQVVLLVALLCGVGLGGALVVTSLMTEFSKVCDGKAKQDPSLGSAYATSYGIFNVAWASGSLAGPLMAAAIERQAGWKTMTWSFGLLCAFCTGPVVIYSGGSRRKVARSTTSAEDLHA